MTDRVQHWISGTPHQGTGDRWSPVHDPATGKERTQVPLATAADVDTAVQAAQRARREWASSTLTRRTQVLFGFRDALLRNREELRETVTAEHGKVLDDADGEIARGLEVVEFACGLAHLLKGEHSPGVSTGTDVHSSLRPVGVSAIITPFNFPVMVPLWFAPLAIACGNPVVLKPSEKDPSASNLLARCWSEAGLPDGVFNVVHGDKDAVDALLEHEDVSSVSFVGSTPVARYVYENGTRNGKRVQALGGAKNHMVVLADADLDAAADAAISAGFGSAGERCMAISALVAQDSIADDLVARIAERTRGLRTGDGRRGCDMGPLITGEHRDRVASYVAAGAREGADVVVDGRGPEVDGETGGFWLGPTLLDRVQPHMSAYTDEIFGPVLSVLRVSDLDDALDLVNANPYGNGTAVFTRDGGAARRFEDEVEVGMVGVNVPIPVPVAPYSFGGWKDSLFGDTHAYGTDGVHFFTRTKTVTTKWPRPSAATVPDLHFPRNS